MDGQRSVIFSRCTHTSTENNPWWRVDLGRVEPVAVVKILNRGHWGAFRLDNSEIRVGRCRYLFQLFECFDYSNVTKFASYHLVIHKYEVVNTTMPVTIQRVVLTWFHVQESQIINKYNKT